MHASARAFFDQILDYAGLFPPAKLPLKDAVKEYREARSNRMLASFVCPTARLQDLLELAMPQSDSWPIDVVALGRATSQASEFAPSIEADLHAIHEYRQAWCDNTPAVPFDETVDVDNQASQERASRRLAGIHTYEAALPAGIKGTELSSILRPFVDRLCQAKLRAFLEVPLTASWQYDVENLCQSTRDCAAGYVGMKLRCGGLTKEAFPSDAQVAFFIAQCRNAGLPWKATAGLHHPRRHWDPNLQCWHHGFLNVFGAGVLAWANPLTEADVIEILADREGKHFCFEEKRFAWKNWECTATQVAEARAAFATTFGSCSFAEPRDDLIAMGLFDLA